MPSTSFKRSLEGLTLGFRRVSLVLAGAVLLALSLLPFTSTLTSNVHAQDATGVCGRTDEVRDALVSASPATACADVTDLHLSDILSLDLSGQSITSLSAGDFDGLHVLDTLDLSRNGLASLPSGLFDELFLLRVLRLEDNQLTALPLAIFDELYLLEELTLNGNELTALPNGMFDDLSRFKGVLAGEEVSGMGRLRQFLSERGPEKAEEFIAALPDLHKQQFVFVYDSQGLGAEFVSSEHPRVITWGADGEFIFAWQTNPDATDTLRDSVEFLIPGGSVWSAGIIDFSGDQAEVAQPATCQTCHGAINKPLWSGYFWTGSESRPEHSYSENGEWSRAMQGHVNSQNGRVAPLDFSTSAFYGSAVTPYYPRWRKPPAGLPPAVMPSEEFAVAISLRHAEVLFSRLRERDDYEEFAEQTLCSEIRNFDAIDPFTGTSSQNLMILARTGEAMGHPNDAASFAPDYEHRFGTIGAAVVFLMLHELWQSDARVRQLYRDTPNGDVPQPGGHSSARTEHYLLYRDGEVSAFDEMIQLYRLLFGHGNRRSLDALNVENTGMYNVGIFTADLGYAHTHTMGPKVCRVLQDEHVPALTVRAEQLPYSHVGEAFSFELHFSEETAISYQDFHNATLTVSGGEVTNAHRLVKGSNIGWGITIDPVGARDVSISLTGDLDCTVDGAVCTPEGKRLSHDLSLTVPGTPLTARLASVPESHDGTPFVFEVHFNQELPLSYRTLRKYAFTVTGGEVTKARRLRPGSNLGWQITVRPEQRGAVNVVLPITTDCTAQGAICTSDGRKLSSRVELTISGPNG